MSLSITSEGEVERLAAVELEEVETILFEDGSSTPSREVMWPLWPDHTFRLRTEIRRILEKFEHINVKSI
jgi:hypothetical protein